jgi:outer membrane protein assembly factor BamB
MQVAGAMAVVMSVTGLVTAALLLPSVPARAATAAVNSPTAGGWTMLGTAKTVTTTSPATLQLTDAAAAGHEAGQSYWPTAVAGAGVNVTFTALINSGTGADGLAFELLDASAGTPVLGVDGGGLGFSGNKGLAVALDTYKNTANPSANFVGLATGAGATTDTLTWGATATNVPTLRNAPITVGVTTTATNVTVTVNGTQVISWTGTVPANVYLAFSGADGGLTDLHAVENVTITANAATTGGGGGALSGPATVLATYLHDNARSSYAADQAQLTATNAGTLKLHWTDVGGQGGFSQPVIANGVAYWGDWNGNEHATNASTGVDLWKTNLGTSTPPVADGCLPPEAGVVGTPTIATVGGTTVVFVPGGDANFYALNATTGAVIWRTGMGTLPDWFLWGSPAVSGTHIYVPVASYGDCPLVRAYLADLNVDTGVMQAQYFTVPAGCVGGGMSSSPIVDTDGSVYVTVGTLDASCAAGEPLAEAIVKFTANLTLVSSWQVPAAQRVVDSDFIATPTLFTATINGVQRSLIGAANKNGTYYAWDRTNLAAGPVWQDQVSSGGSCPQCNGSGSSISPSSFDGTTLFVAGESTTIGANGCAGSLQGVNPATGAYLWRDCLSGPVLGGVMEVPGVVSVGYGTHLLVARSSDGTSLYDYTAAGLSYFYGTPTIAGGLLYAVNMNGNLLAFGQ